MLQHLLAISAIYISLHFISFHFNSLRMECDASQDLSTGKKSKEKGQSSKKVPCFFFCVWAEPKLHSINREFSLISRTEVRWEALTSLIPTIPFFGWNIWSWISVKMTTKKKKKRSQVRCRIVRHWNGYNLCGFLIKYKNSIKFMAMLSEFWKVFVLYVHKNHLCF